LTWEFCCRKKKKKKKPKAAPGGKMGAGLRALFEKSTGTTGSGVKFCSGFICGGERREQKDELRRKRRTRLRKFRPVV